MATPPRVSGPAGSTAWLTLSFILATVAAAAEAGAADIQRLTPGRAVLHRATGKVTQKTGDDIDFHFDVTASVVTLVEAGNNGKPDRLLVAQGYHATSGDDVSEGGVLRRWLVTADPDRELVPLETPFELDAAIRNLKIYFPFDAVPPFALPAPDSEMTGEAEVAVIGQIPTRTIFTVTRAVKDGRHVVRRRLASGSRPAVNFGDKAARLIDWDETYVLDPARGILERSSHSSTMLLEEDNTTVTISNEVTTTAVVDLGGDRGKALRSALTAIGAIEADFRARRSSDEIAVKVEAIRKKLEETDQRDLTLLASTHLREYRETFESSKASRLLAGLIGKAPPELAFEDLTGTRRSVTELIKGKVVYLNFWGVG